MAPHHTQLTSIMLGHGKHTAATWMEVKTRKKDKHIFLLITLNMRFRLGNTGYLKQGLPLFQKGKWLLQVDLPRLARGWKLLRVNTCRTTYENLPANSKQCARMKWLCHKDIYENITCVYKTVRSENWVDIILRSLGYLDENIYMLSCNLPESSEGERFAHVEVICACHILGDSVTTFIFKWSWPKKKPPANEVNESHLQKYSANRRILRKEAWIAMRQVANLDAAMDAI